MGVLYSVKDWAAHYEKAGTRTVANTTWVPISHKHDGKSYRRLIAMRDGLAIYGAWILVLQVAAKCPARGVLADRDGEPLTPQDLAFKTGAPEKAFERALEVLIGKDIGWLIATHCNGLQQIATPCNEAQLQDRTGQDITEQDRTEEIPAAEPPKRFTPPTIEDLLAYCLERKNTVDPQQFMDHYIARGWKFPTGKTMVCWKATVRTWEKNNFGKPAGKREHAIGPGQKFDPTNTGGGWR